MAAGEPPLPPTSSVEADGSASGAPASSSHTLSPRSITAADSAFAQEVVERINRARWQNSLPPLKRNANLDAAAAYHSQDMAVDNYFFHDSYNRVGGDLVFDRLWYERVGSYYTGWSLLGECIAAGYTSPEAVVQGWLNSSGHRAVLLSSNYREIGSGYYYQASGSDYTTYWTTDYGCRSNVYPLVINLEAAMTDQRQVSLYVYGQGWATEMAFSNDGVNWTAWQPYSPNRTWTLPCGTGNKTVYVRLRNGSEEQVISDTIRLEGEEYRLRVGQNKMAFLYSIETGEIVPSPSQATSIENRGLSCDELGWEADRTGDWFTVSPISQTTPFTLTVTPTDFLTETQGIYTGTVTITATQPPEASGSPQVVAVDLIVAERIYHTFVPLVVRSW